VALVATAALTLGACGQEAAPGATDADTGGSDGSKPVVGLVMKSLGNQYFQAMQEGAEAYAAENDAFELKAVGIQSETDITGQVEAVNNLVAQGVDALVVAPADSRALVAPLAQAIEQGITVVNIDVKLDDEALASAGVEIPFVGPDNVEGARLAGEVLAEDLGEAGKVVIIEGIQGAANAEQRKEGFEKAAEEGGLEIVASSTANWETEQANTVFANILSANPDIQGVMAANDSMALGVLAALESAGKLGEIPVVGFDNLPEVHPYLDNGSMLATVDQFGSQQAVFGIDVALDVLGGGTAEDWVKTDIELVTEASGS
jgi:ribose transport system substrate-binding protein